MGSAVKDLVICGHGKDAISALAFVREGYLDDLDNVVDDDGVLIHPTLRADLAAGLQRFAAEGGGSSMRITRVLALAKQPSFAKGEITQKGNLNKKLLLETRSKWVSRLLDNADDAIVMLTKP
jgi:feruloyl-CoA synthase